MGMGRRYGYVSIPDDLDSTFTFKHDQSTNYSINGIVYRLNSLGFRSEEFTSEHKGDHVLFIGCSVTFGSGLPLEKTWSKLVYNKMSKSRNLSGYFNLSYPGAASTEIIFNTMKYIKKFGAPKEIYFMMPEIMRGVHFEKSSAILHSVEMYTMFEDFCKAVGIKLVSVTWDIQDISGGFIQTANDFYERFETFHRIEYKALSSLFYEYVVEHDKEPNLFVAGDGIHHGTAYNYGFAKNILNIIGDSNGL
jgi:hypothetical protein